MLQGEAPYNEPSKTSEGAPESDVYQMIQLHPGDRQGFPCLETGGL